MTDNACALKYIDHIRKADRYILIDTENTGPKWLDVIKCINKIDGTDNEEITADERMVTVSLIFYTDNSPKLSYDDSIQMSEMLKKLVLIKCFTGEKAASALDFQLVSVAGYLIAKHPKAEYVILSKDKGYDPMADFWQKRGVNIFRRTLEDYLTPEEDTDTDDALSVTSDETDPSDEESTDSTVPGGAASISAVTKKEKKAMRDAFITEILPGYDEKTRNKVKSIIGNYNGDLKKFYQSVIKNLGQKKGLSIYKSIKPHLDEYAQLLK